MTKIKNEKKHKIKLRYADEIDDGVYMSPRMFKSSRAQTEHTIFPYSDRLNQEQINQRSLPENTVMQSVDVVQLWTERLRQDSLKFQRKQSIDGVIYSTQNGQVRSTPQLSVCLSS